MEGILLHSFGWMVRAEGKLVDKDGKLYAHDTTTCIILRPSKEMRKEE
jgi:hypothetical protein